MTLLWDTCPSRPSYTHTQTHTHRIPRALASVAEAGCLPSDDSILSQGGKERRGKKMKEKDGNAAEVDEWQATPLVIFTLQ